MGKGVGDKGNVGRRDVRQAAPVGRPAVFSVSPFPDVFCGLRRKGSSASFTSLRFLLSFLSGNERNASLGIKEERRLQTAPATPVNGDPHKPIVFPFPSLFAAGGLLRRRVTLRANPVDVVTVTLAACCPSSHTPAFVSTPRARP